MNEQAQAQLKQPDSWHEQCGCATVQRRQDVHRTPPALRVRQVSVAPQPKAGYLMIVDSSSGLHHPARSCPTPTPPAARMHARMPKFPQRPHSVMST
eukprot:4787140-Pleurochrysis_carterae.AAC.1